MAKAKAIKEGISLGSKLMNTLKSGGKLAGRAASKTANLVDTGLEKGLKLLKQGTGKVDINFYKAIAHKIRLPQMLKKMGYTDEQIRAYITSPKVAKALRGMVTEGAIVAGGTGGVVAGKAITDSIKNS